MSREMHTARSTYLSVRGIVRWMIPRAPFASYCKYIGRGLVDRTAEFVVRGSLGVVLCGSLMNHYTLVNRSVHTQRSERCAY